MHPIFQPDDRMADLVFASHRLVNILPRFGISFGFADRSVSQVCAQYGIDATLFLQICNLYANLTTVQSRSACRLTPISGGCLPI